MKILITGGYGFIGSHVADRFYKEGHKVFIIDNLSTGSCTNFKGKHKFYKLDVQDHKCEEIFKSNHFDAVIHLADRTDAEHYEINLSGLSNIISLSSKYGVKKFIYASSVEVYGNCDNVPAIDETFEKRPVTRKGYEKLIEEDYCSKIQQLNKLSVICFRMSEVYGPRQSINGHFSTVSNLIKNVIDHRDIPVSGDGTQTVNLIYISDLADAIYQSVFTDMSGPYNLTSNTQHSINELISMLSMWHETKKISCSEKENKEVPKSNFNIDKLKKKIDWVPIYGLAKGLDETVRWYSKNFDSINNQALKEKTKRHKVFDVMINGLPYIENLLVFILLLAGSYFWGDSFSNYIITCSTIYIVIFAVSFGLRQSLISAFLCCLLFVGNTILKGGDILSLLMQPSNLFQLFIIVSIGLVVGFIAQSKKQNNNELKEMCKKYQADLQFYGERNEEQVKKINDLQSQILEDESSLLKIYSSIKKLDSVEPECIYFNTLQVASELLNAQNMSLYFVDNDDAYLRLLAKDLEDEYEIQQTVAVEKDSPYQKVISTNKIYVNKSFNKQYPLLIVPIQINNKVSAIINFHNVPFENLSLNYKNTLLILSSIVSSALSRSIKFQKLLNRERYIEGTKFLSEKYFDRVLKMKQKARSNEQADFCALEIQDNKASLSETSSMLERNLRKVDYWGYMSGKYYILLTNTSASKAKTIVEKLNTCGLNTEIIHR